MTENERRIWFLAAIAAGSACALGLILGGRRHASTGGYAYAGEQKHRPGVDSDRKRRAAALSPDLRIRSADPASYGDNRPAGPTAMRDWPHQRWDKVDE